MSSRKSARKKAQDKAKFKRRRLRATGVARVIARRKQKVRLRKR